MNVLVIGLAVIGLGCLLLLAISALTGTESAATPPPVVDAAAPYREGLHAAVRMQRVAQDLEQQLYAAAAQQMEAEGASPSEPAS